MDFTNCSEKKREKGSVPAGPEQPQGSGPASDAAQPSRRARAPGLNLTGGAQLPVGERGGEREVRMTGGARLSSLTSRPEGQRAHRRQCRAWWVELTARLDSAWSRHSGGGGGASGGGCSGRLRVQTKGKRRGKESGPRCGSRSSERSGGGASYRANTGDPRHAIFLAKWARPGMSGCSKGK